MLKNNSGPFQCPLLNTTFSSVNFSWNCWVLVHIVQLLIKKENVVVVQSLTCVWLCDPMDCSTPGSSVFHCLPEFTQTCVHQVDDATNHLILCGLPLLLPSIFPSIRIFSNESALCIRWPKYWNFRLNISPSNEHPGFISLRMDWWISLQSKGLSRLFSSTSVRKPQFFSAQQ